MLKYDIPEDLEEIIKDIVAHRDLEKLDKYYEGELIYAEIPYYGDVYDEENWKIEIEL